MNLVRSENGTIALFGLFMTLVLTACVYVVVVFTGAIVHAEGMQDAADAAAFASAVVQARGMNLLSFLNLVMAALVAVLIALRLAQAFFVIMAAVLTGLAWVTMGATLPLAAVSTEQAVTMQNAFDRAKDVVFPLLEALHTTERAVKVIVPWVAATDALVEVADHHPVASGAFALPGALALPVEPDEFPVLCEHGAEMTASLALLPVRPIIPGEFLDALEDAAGEMGRALSGFLCGDGSGEPPSHEETIDEGHPRPPGLDACERAPNDPTCQNARRILARAAPRRTDGSCQDEPTCGYRDPYETWARAARTSCRPRSGFSPKEYSWQEHEVTAHFRYVGAAWIETERSLGRARLRATEDPPCGPRGMLGREWNEDSGPVGAAVPDALCASDLGFVLGSATEGAVKVVEFRQATRLFSCVTEVERSFPLADKEDAFGGEGSSRRSPHRVEDALTLGDEAFQVRALAFGSRPSTRPGSAWLEVAPGVTGEDRDEPPLLPALAGVSIAQAEYYFDHDGSVQASDWLWDLRWTARLVRFRLPSAEEKERESRRTANGRDRSRSDRERFGGLSEHSPSSACQDAGATECGALDEQLSLFDSLVIH